MNSRNEKDLAVSTRIRLARNIASLPYPHKMNHSQAEELVKTVWDAFSNSPLKNELKIYDIKELSDIEKKALVEKHLISPEICASKVPCAAIISRDEKISIMVNEEDHLRIQVFSDGLDVESAYDMAKKVETLLSEKLIGEYVRQTGCALILVTHSLQQARRLADEVLYFHKGELLESGLMEKLLYTPEKEETRQFLEFYGI